MVVTIGIISIGDMGGGIARLLIAHKYRVITNVSDRSDATQSRARAAGVELLSTDAEVIAEADYILSIVPPRDAKTTAERIATAYKSAKRSSSEPLYFLDLNAIAPSTARSIAAQFKTEAPDIRMIDGGIIGRPPKPSTPPDESDYVPSMCLSGPHHLTEATRDGARLSKILNTRHVSSEIGTASGLKCCFASLAKGYTALAIQSFTTASSLGVLPHLEDYITTHSGAERLALQQKSLVGMAPKAYRWVDEMREIDKTFAEDGRWAEESVFGGIAGVFRFVAKGSVLGKEQVERRVRGTTARDVVDALGEGLEVRRRRRGSI